MNISLLIKFLLVLLGFAYIGLTAFQFEAIGSGVCALMIVLLTLLYGRYTKVRKRKFYNFLLLFAIAEVIGFISWFIPIEWLNPIDWSYYVVNLLYISAYIYLIIHIITSMDFNKVIKKLFGPAIVLLALDIFCVYIVTDTASGSLGISEYILEFTYNGVIMALLSVALLNYLYRDSNKAMLFLIGSIFIVFSEIIQLAYFYIVDSNDLSATFATFLVMAFLFFYLQSQLSNSRSFTKYRDEELKVY
jgi:hypothetical protein